MLPVKKIKMIRQNQRFKENNLQKILSYCFGEKMWENDDRCEEYHLRKKDYTHQWRARGVVDAVKVGAFSKV